MIRWIVRLLDFATFSLRVDQHEWIARAKEQAAQRAAMADATARRKFS